jgi:hypothetical protein
MSNFLTSYKSRLFPPQDIASIGEIYYIYNKHVKNVDREYYLEKVNHVSLYNQVKNSSSLIQQALSNKINTSSKFTFKLIQKIIQKLDKTLYLLEQYHGGEQLIDYLTHTVPDSLTLEFRLTRCRKFLYVSQFEIIDQDNSPEYNKLIYFNLLDDFGFVQHSIYLTDSLYNIQGIYDHPKYVHIFEKYF